ncbi:SCP2 sterol-binding domain-containing protein [Caulobacter sp. KR2-114]|jgi:Fe-S-cluster-containing hydrogenase component 2|uniref:SCP2 sterol-binding domain-containing protein n=1 Tax=Caulobacter sp. KR2-114 TaxID=3400912 RepID=UPI003C0EAC63
MSLSDHPSVQRHRSAGAAPRANAPLTEAEVLQLCRDCGADDVALLSADDPAIAAQRNEIERIFPEARTVVSFVCQMNREPVRATVRSIANQEFHETYDSVNETARTFVRELQNRGHRAVNAVAAFPMEQDNFPGKNWALSHKPIAVAAGLGKMGLHRCVIHPKFGSFVLLGTILLADEVRAEKRVLDYNPCLECKLCVAACPVEAIGVDGSFNMLSCYTHNYREFLGGFGDWVETIADSKSADEYRERVPLNETASMWQSLSFKPSYKAAFCISVCPAGEDVLGPFLEDRAAFVDRFVKPLQDKSETIYVLDGSDAQDIVAKKFPNKKVKTVSWMNVEPTGPSLLFGMRLSFQRRRSKGLDATFHMHFTGPRAISGTVSVRRLAVDLDFGLKGVADVVLRVSGPTWVELLSRKLSVPDAMADGRLEVEGDAELVTRLVECYPRYGRVAQDGSVAEPA